MLSSPNDETQRISSVINEFLRYQRSCNHSPRTIQFYREKLLRFQRFAAANNVIEMMDITAAVARNYIIELQGEAHTEGGVHAFFRAIRAIVNWYQVDYEPVGWSNPFDKKVKAPVVHEKMLDPVSGEVVAALVKACEYSAYAKRDKAMVLFLEATGGRAFEILALDRKDIDLHDCSAIIRYGKGGYYRFIFYDQRTRNALRSYLNTRQDNYKALWINRYQQRLKYGGLREIIIRLSERAGIEPPTPHSFRRAYAVNKLNANMPDMTVVQLMGQHSINALRPYTKMSKDRLQRAYLQASND